MNKTKIYIIFSIVLIIVSILYTVMVKNIDVAKIGPENSEVGFSTINKNFHNKFGYNETWYDITKYCGTLPFMLVAFYAGRGIKELIQKKSFKKVDKKLYALAIFYIVFAIVYLFFEKVIINYRPVLEEGNLEASYPSSHTLLAICLCGSSILVSRYFISNEKVRRIVDILTMIVMVVIVIGRTVSGVHWMTDIIGGIIISICLLTIFKTSLLMLEKNEE